MNWDSFIHRQVEHKDTNNWTGSQQR